MLRLTALFALSLVLATLAACGQKGPLYMPNDPHPPVYVPPPKPTPAPASSAPAAASSAAGEQD